MDTPWHVKRAPVGICFNVTFWGIAQWGKALLSLRSARHHKGSFCPLRTLCMTVWLKEMQWNSLKRAKEGETNGKYGCLSVLCILWYTRYRELWSLPVHPQHVTLCLVWFPACSSMLWFISGYSCFRCSVWRADPTEETEEAGRRSGSDSRGASKPSESAKPFPQTNTWTVEHDKKACGRSAAVQPALIHRQDQSDGKNSTGVPKTRKSEVWGVEVVGKLFGRTEIL